MRLLVVVPPFTGHVNPMIGVAAELVARGHRVAWAGDADLLGDLLPPGLAVHPCAGLDIARPAGLRGFAALKHLWDDVLLPLTEAMTPGVEAALDAEEPDVVVADQQAFAGAFAAERRGLPWVTSATTSSELVDPLAALPAVAAGIEERLTGLRARFGAPGGVDPRFSPRLTLAFTSAALVPGEPTAAGPVRFVGPVPRPAEPHPFDFARLDPERPLVYVSLGTVNDDAGARFLTECAAALAERPHLQGVIADPAGVVTAPHVITAARLPQQAVLDRAAAVVCHAGHNTVCESLARGLPLVVAPIRDDQPVIAEQVTAAGAGVRLRFAHATARHIGQAVDAVVADPAHRAAAHRIRESFAAAGGAPAAADALEELL
ncbi:PGL/p-HBAD biosynthesis glycosyltransferase [Actinokineospora sp. UTMC 2448]|nr:glycosyltransferase [Actinokineospora sp. UTMC 2448]UVS78907.1 PGL/p-HBAD biosynthesis glycosyltransferase [Actinokineospora sp. UTMC 2448]